jgi:hypothetical protein
MGPNPQSPIPNPQSPIPNPQSPIYHLKFDLINKNKYTFFKKKKMGQGEPIKSNQKIYITYINLH